MTKRTPPRNTDPNEPTSITFVASIGQQQSAIKVSGDNTGMYVVLHVPENQMGAAVRLMTWRAVALEVTIKPIHWPEDAEDDG